MKREAITETWNARSALRLSNGAMEVVLLRGGGHIAELRRNGVNCLWTAPWKTADPGEARADALAAQYGGGAVGRFLAGDTGHAVSLNLLGSPPNENAEPSAAFYGEAATREWSFELRDGGCVGRVELPVAQLALTRDTSLAKAAAVLFVKERVENRSDAAREVRWAQQLSLGAPLVEPEYSRIDASLDRAKTSPWGYKGHDMLRGDVEFAWPFGPAAGQNDAYTVDLRIPFARAGCGWMAAAEVDPERELSYITALNWRLGLALIYGFRRQDFPWVAIWEENGARAGAPGLGKAQVRGMEFGTTPMPLGQAALREAGELFGIPGSRIIEAGGVLEARYFAAIAEVPKHWHGVGYVAVEGNEVTVVGAGNNEHVTVAAEGISAFLGEELGAR